MNELGTVDRVDGASQSQAGAAATASHAREVDPLSVTKRLQRDGRWAEVEPVRDRMIKDCRKKGMSKPDAQAWTYSELDRRFPPLGTEGMLASDSQTEPAATADPGVSGLGDLPEAWPTLPANASLQAEISWVSANRLRVRDGNGGESIASIEPSAILQRVELVRNEHSVSQQICRYLSEGDAEPGRRSSACTQGKTSD